ncbi:hypothetical protein N8550_01855, partial [Pirellulaceae bacterium]|nr:hypothetical protein [Pirellulaceae bacterium]
MFTVRFSRLCFGWLLYAWDERHLGFNSLTSNAELQIKSLDFCVFIRRVYGRFWKGMIYSFERCVLNPSESLNSDQRPIEIHSRHRNGGIIEKISDCFLKATA